MSSSSSPVLVAELPGGWPRLLPAGILLLAAVLFPWWAFAWTAALRMAAMLIGMALAIVAAWQIGGSARRITRVVWSRSGEWYLHFAKGDPVTAVLTAGSWQSPWLMCWRWIDANGRRHALLLWRGQFAPGDWHLWRLRLRLEGHRTGEAIPEALP